MKETVSIHEIVETNFVNYDRDTGIFTWKIPSNSSIKIGSEAGSYDKDGYLIIKINKKAYKAHRLAWKYIYGNYPIGNVDHINQNRADNRICNLRDVNHSTNMKNQKKRKDNKSGTSGVIWNSKTNRWRARITVDSKKIHLGYFGLYNEAVNARKNAEILYGFHENHGA